MSERDWAGYYAKTGARPPRATLVFALDLFAEEDAGSPARTETRLAVDLGSGSGRDVVEMARRGWRVIGIDAEPAAIEALTARDDLPADAQVEGRVDRFEEAEWPACDLVNSSFALPLCPPAAFPALWDRIVTSLKPGGRFSGQLYGPRDSWASREGMTFHTRAQAEALLDGLEVEMFEEEEDESTTPRGETKHWHIFHIVARKP